MPSGTHRKGRDRVGGPSLLTRVLVCAPTLLGGVGCSLLLLDDFAGADSPVAPAEAEAGADASGVDAGADARAVDAGGHGGRFCASLSPAPRLCADFDGTEPLAFGFSEARQSPGALLALDDLAFSSPRSVVMRTTGDCANVDLTREVVGPATTFHATYELRLGTRDGGFSPLLFGLFEVEPPPGGDGGGGCSGYMSASAEAVRLHYGSGSVALARRPYPGVWAKVEIEYVQRPTGLGVMVHVDDEPALDAEVVSLGCSLGSKFIQRFGIFCSNGEPELRVDDVILDWR